MYRLSIHGHNKTDEKVKTMREFANVEAAIRPLCLTKCRADSSINQGFGNTSTLNKKYSTGWQLIAMDAALFKYI